MDNSLDQIPVLLRLLRRFRFPHKLGVMDWIFGSSLHKKGVSWMKTYTGHTWKLDLRNPCHRWMLYDDYAGPQFLNWVRENIPPSGVIVDSGANVGQFLPYFSEVVPDGKILAFEPSLEASQWVEDCLNRNSQMPVELIRKGLGVAKDTLYLQVPGPESSRGLWGEIHSDEGVPVSITPLSEELRHRSLKTVHLWKLDVEGHEVPALRGAEQLLKNQSVHSLYIEMTTKDDNNEKILRLMQSYGYDCYLFEESGSLKKSNQPLSRPVDGLFLPS